MGPSPRLSVIIPVYGDSLLLTRCLESLRASTFTDFEIIVSDDGSPAGDSIRQAAEAYRARYLHSASRRGSAAARNRASDLATAEILVFIDADVSVRPTTLAQLCAALESDPQLDAVIGSYDSAPSAPNLISQFRNLMHAHAHQGASADAQTFWTGCGAIRRSRFRELNGFKESFRRPAIEDVELGLRLHQIGGRIRLDRTIQVTHHKHWNIFSMVETDLFARAIPWTATIAEYGLPADLNFHWRQRAGAALTGLVAPLLLIALRHNPGWWAVLALLLAAIAFCHAPLLRFLAAARGAVFAIRCFPLILVFNLTCISGLVAGLLLVEGRRDRWFWPAIGASAALIVGLQCAGGAYRAEFNSHPDEASHFVSGLMVHDYLSAWPAENPVAWCLRYYLHYPRVAIGHWPPGFPLMEAAWWLLFPPSRFTAMTLNAAMALLCALLFYRMARTRVPGWLALCGALLMLAAGDMQEGFSRSMCDLPCLLFAMLVLDATLRLLRRPSRAAWSLIVLWLVCGMLTRASIACLVPVPALALLFTGKWRTIPRQGALVAAGALFLLGSAWYLMRLLLFHENLLGWGGVRLTLPWPVLLFPNLAGPGVIALAIAGIAVALRYRRPLASAAAALLLATAGVSFFLRAMNETRHVLIVLPALLLLSVEVIHALRPRRVLSLAGAALALGFFPWTLYRQQPAGFAAIAGQLHLPSRTLVSSTALGEGGWISTLALADRHRPSSAAVRATQTLITGVGIHYGLSATTPAEVEQRLDELAIDTVISQSDPGYFIRPHRLLLVQTLDHSPSWRLCIASATSLAYCRALPPRFPRQPQTINLRQLGRVISE